MKFSETGAVKKTWHGKISVCLIYPNHYHLGMSNLGFQTVYSQLNQMDHVVCERAFLSESFPKQTKETRSLETSRALKEFDILAFSVSFENDFPNILNILESAEIPWLSDDRSDSHPLVAAGGVACFSNPEPVAPFIDLFFLGEAEEMLEKFFQVYDPGMDRRKNLLEIVQKVPGTYVPSFYKVSYHNDGTLKDFEPVEDAPESVVKICAEDISRFSTMSTILTQKTSFENTFLIEVSRGCRHGCRFCSAGYLYRPPRCRSLEQLTDNLEYGASRAGHIGILGAAVSDHPDIEKLCLMAREKKLRLSFSSLRVDALSGELIRALKNSGVKTATIAPEAGTQRMLDVINKGILLQQVFSAAETLVAGGIPNLKLYFMVGLPTETMEDVRAIVTVCKKIRHGFLSSSRAQKRIGEVTVSLNSFVPKPATPFQWAAMDDVPALKRKIKCVKEGLRKVPNLKVHADIPRWAYLQGLLSRGDRKVSALISKSVKNRGNWPQTFKESSLNADFYVLRNRGEDEIFPWDFIDHGVKKSFLLKEYHRGLKAEKSPPCPAKKPCLICGACEKEIKNRPNNTH